MKKIINKKECNESEHGYDYKVSNIAWDVDDEDLDNLPESIIVTVPEDICAVEEEEEWISDYLSDTYGFCHNGFLYDAVGQFEESMDIRKHRFVPKMDTSTKAIKSMKDKERERERRNWNQRLRNGDYDDFEDDDLEECDESGSYEQCPNCGDIIHLADGETEIECPYCGEMVEFYTDKIDSKNSDDDTYEFTVTDIEWDTDGEDASELHLPKNTVVDVPMECVDNGSAEVEDYISDFLSDTYGFCHNGFKVEGLDDDSMNESRQNEDWFGIKGATFIYHGDWADPEIHYDGVSLNYFDVEEGLLDVYREENPNDKNDKGFDDWMAKPSTKSIIQSELDNLVQGGCGTPLDEYDRDEEVFGDYMIEDSSDDELLNSDIHDKVGNLSWEDFWGNDAEYDIAQDCEDIYEEGHGVSAVYWTDFNSQGQKTPSDSLVDRPDEYATHGYTGEFEDWGIRMTTKAISNGCVDSDSIIEFIKKNDEE